MESEKEIIQNTQNDPKTTLTDQYAKQSWKKGDQSKKLFVKNISHLVKDEDLAKYFSQWPDVALVRAFTVKSKGQHKHNGIGFVEFLSKEDTDRVMTYLESDSKILKGAKLEVNRALAKKDRTQEKPVKAQKIEKIPEKVEESEEIVEEDEEESSEIDFEAKELDEIPRTVFLRNLPTLPPTCLPNSKPFKIVDRLKRDIKFMAQNEFGEVENVTVTVNKVSGLPLGTAFVLFKSAESAENMIERSRAAPIATSKSDITHVTEALNKAKTQLGSLLDEKLGVFLYKNPIAAFPAVTRTDLKEKTESRNSDEGKILGMKSSHQSRKLKEAVGHVRDSHLVAEGLILPGSDEAKESGISEQDLTLRVTSWENRKKKLRAPHFVVDPLRLCLRNMPKTWDEARLRTAVQNAVSLYRDHCIENGVNIEPKAAEEVPIKYLKIQRDAVGKSLCYAFIHFQEHADALCCLRQLNNNPSVFTDTRRPIVEFALDNSHKTRRHREDNMKTKEEREAEKEQKSDRRPQRFSGPHAKKRRS